ncbi:uncharacterized protein TRAVEDRAFT_20169 [Trametes versicolor FP-101664 SS1]|uniref:uncharacterized protein n=1 Tax=Trametes versicolor (strain FP-101664) TaxID=717944 RepID=UPI00046243F6|nr:uncharacterized protein TRAVEDRAFT_20169 [Trametes versicolor FP-101664 SS1]EIW59905.1 hypothetical protein TRAVEDRAFT_20169 [Trametes versicolor FP-101664 SS1]
MKDKRLAVLAVQEAHLTPERIDNLNSLFAASLLILGSPDPENGAAARGIAFVITTILLPWSKDKSISIANVYAPNAARENAAFWDELNAIWAVPGCRRPEVMLGDFNMVENALDRVPERADVDVVTCALSSLLSLTDLQDSWRKAHPNERSFTFRQPGSATVCLVTQTSV